MTEDVDDQSAPAQLRCVACGSPAAQPMDTTEGRLLMCPPCVALHDIACP